MIEFSAALSSRALHLLLALFSPPRGRHSRPRFLGSRRRSTRVRRYAANPEPARRSTVHLPRGSAPARPLAPPAEVFPADDISPVRPYYTAHERSFAENGDDRAQAEALARLARWTGAAEPPAPAPARVPAPRPGDLLAPRQPEPEPAPEPAAQDDPFAPMDLADLEKAVRAWVAQQHRRREVGV
ncbi:MULTISPECIES: hypothetical protein [unclassified Nocardiopsis]|uniref:hypothetical protein n=1 Tax=Nocardiopsis TaxID=2013 RepID=UPI00387B913F